MASSQETQEQEERTEEATPQRREQALSRGQLPRSRDLSAALTLLAGVLSLYACGEHLSVAIEKLCRSVFAAPLSYDAARAGLFGTALAAAPIFGVTTLVALASMLVQTGVPKASWFRLDFSRINPGPKLGQLFSFGTSGWELAKAALKLVLTGLCAYQILHPFFATLGQTNTAPSSLLSQMKDLSMGLLLRLSLLFLALSAFDYFLSRRRFERELRMSRHEIREELRHSEGHPQIKRSLRRKARELLKRRVQVEVPKADVVVVNPTHYAVAISYKAQQMRAPKVVAKGVDSLALRIRELARGAGVPVLNNPPLARLLHQKVAVGAEVPVDLYKAVAEVLAFVYRIRNQTARRPS